MDLAGPFNRIHPSTNSDASRSPLPEVSILGWKLLGSGHLPGRLIRNGGNGEMISYDSDVTWKTSKVAC